MDILNNIHNGDITSGTTQPFWLDGPFNLTFAPLASNLKTEVVIVGGGIAGLTTAYCLCREGKKVVLVEDGNICSGETGRTTAHLVSALDDRYFHLEKLYGAENTRLIAHSHQNAIDFIEDTVSREHIDCDFERLDGYLFPDPNDPNSVIDKEFEAASSAGVQVEKVRIAPGLMKAEGPCLKFSRQAQFHPVKYGEQLCQAIVKMGGIICTGTHADKISHEGITDSRGFTVEASHVVIATNSPVNNKYAIHLKQYPYRTYVIGAQIRKNSVPHALWWDTGDRSVNAEIPPYHYVRIQKLDEQFDLLICGGEDHPRGLTEPLTEEERYQRLETWAREHFILNKVVYRWSGQVMEPMDSLAFIGRNPMDNENVYIITGDSGNGMTHGTLAGQLITDLICGRSNKLESIYNPSRFKIFSAGKTFFKEFVVGAISYLTHKADPVKVDELRNLPDGEGVIVEMEGKSYGAYKDETGQLYLLSTECTHLKCSVKWNASEKSWDCPCHGSRFTGVGKVINGPANADLPAEPIEFEKRAGAAHKSV